jgi:hypothetical protein
MSIRVYLETHSRGERIFWQIQGLVTDENVGIANQLKNLCAKTCKGL